MVVRIQRRVEVEGGDGERVDSRGKKEKRKPPRGCGAMCEWANARGGTKRKEK